MNDYIPWFYMDIITYPCPNLNVGLANLCKKKKAQDFWVALADDEGDTFMFHAVVPRFPFAVNLLADIRRRKASSV